jgi:hypothetical protein
MPTNLSVCYIFVLVSNQKCVKWHLSLSAIWYESVPLDIVHRTLSLVPDTMRPAYNGTRGQFFPLSRGFRFLQALQVRIPGTVNFFRERQYSVVHRSRLRQVWLYNLFYTLWSVNISQKTYEEEWDNQFLSGLLVIKAIIFAGTVILNGNVSEFSCASSFLDVTDRRLGLLQFRINGETLV